MKLTTSQAAKQLGIHPDTLRKHARAGKVPFVIDLNGHMQFDSNTIGVAKAAVPAKLKVNRTKVIFVIDRSGSMSGLISPMNKALTEQYDAFRANSTLNDVYDVGSILFSTTPDSFSGWQDVHGSATPSITRAIGGTALRDALLRAIEQVNLDMLTNHDTAYLIVAITDGEENQSVTSESSLKALVATATATDRVTIVMNCPPSGVKYASSLGIAPGNVRAWEGTTGGLESMSYANVGATQSYGATRSMGITSSTSYYANLGGDADVVAKKLDATMNDVTKLVDVKRVEKTDPSAIQKFAIQKFGAYEKGSFFYQLVKSETVQPYKRIIVQDQKTGQFFHGFEGAKKLLGLPANAKGEIKVKPGNLGQFTMFVQSTSYNRKVPAGTVVVKLR